MKGHTWIVKDQVTGEQFTYKRYQHGNYYMKRERRYSIHSSGQKGTIQKPN